MELITNMKKDILPDSAMRKNMQNGLLIGIAEGTYSQSIPTSFLEVIPGKGFIPQDQPNKASNFPRKRAGPNV